MRGIRWPLLGAVLLPLVTAVTWSISDPAAIRSAAVTTWLLLSGFGAVAGIGFYLQARLGGDPADLLLPKTDRALERAYLSGSAAAGEQIFQREAAEWAALRARAEHSRRDAHRYRRLLEVELREVDRLLRTSGHEGLDLQQLAADRATLTADLRWAEQREGLLGRLLA